MHFLRFGSSIPGSYWGCCAVCILQEFKYDPSAKASIQIVSGDSGTAIMNYNGGKCEDLFAGPTYEDIFWQRLRIGTFSETPMPNHAFFAILTDNQLRTTVGKKWLKLLKQAGFEFIRTTDNSVYSGQGIASDFNKTASSEPEVTWCEGCNPDNCSGCSEDGSYDDPLHGAHPNYIFGLFRNIGNGYSQNPFMPPEEWLDLDGGIEEANTSIINQGENIRKAQQDFHLKVWNELCQKPLMPRSEISAIIPEDDLILAGQRSEFPQEPQAVRDSKMKAKKPAHAAKAASPWQV